MNSIKSLMGMVCTEAVMYGGMSEEQVRRHGPPEEPRRKDVDEPSLSVPFPSLVRYVNPDGTERYEWVD